MVRLLPRVDPHVALERLKVAEMRAADLTRVRLLPSVDQHMGTKVRHLEERRRKGS